MNPNYINLKKKKVKELKKMCKDKKIKGYSKLKKRQLVELLFKNLFPNEEFRSKIIKQEPIEKPILETILEHEHKDDNASEIIEEVKDDNASEVKNDNASEIIEEIKEVKEEHPLKIKLDILKPIEPRAMPRMIIKPEDDFEAKYNKLLKENIEKLKKINEKKNKKKKQISNIDLNDIDYINTINNLISKLYFEFA